TSHGEGRYNLRLQDLPGGKGYETLGSSGSVIHPSPTGAAARPRGSGLAVLIRRVFPPPVRERGPSVERLLDRVRVVGGFRYPIHVDRPRMHTGGAGLLDGQ